MLKEFQFEQNALDFLAQGVINACLPLKGTYGPYGKEVLIESDQKKLLLTKSSAAIMQNYSDSNLFLDEGVKLVREAVLNTAEYAGDGTTLTAILIESMVKRAKTFLTAGYSYTELRKGLKDVTNEVIASLEDKKKPCTKRKQMNQMLSFHFGNSKEILLLEQALGQVGPQGMIRFESAYGRESFGETLNGMPIFSEVITNEIFRNKQKKELELLNPIVFVCDEVIADFSMLLPILSYANEKKRALFIIAEDITEEAKKIMEVNIKKQVITAAAVKIKGIGKSKRDLLEDICVYTGATFASKKSGYDFLRLQEEVFGIGEKITITQDKVLIRKNKCDQEEKLHHYIEHIKKQKDDCVSNVYDKERYEDRIRRLNGTVSVLYVGETTLATEKEEIRKLQSALRMIRKSVEEGVVAGGGSALLFVAKEMLEVLAQKQSNHRVDYICGKKLLLHALTEPFKLLCDSSEGDGLIQFEKMKKFSYPMGYDIEKKEMRNFEECGMLDSFYVIKTAILQAVSITYEWLSTAVLMVSTKPDREDVELMKQGVPIMR